MPLGNQARIIKVEKERQGKSDEEVQAARFQEQERRVAEEKKAADFINAGAAGAQHNASMTRFGEGLLKANRHAPAEVEKSKEESSEHLGVNFLMFDNHPNPYSSTAKDVKAPIPLLPQCARPRIAMLLKDLQSS